MTTEELLALRKQKEAQVASMSIEQVINGLKNDDPLYGLIARLYVARCMEWATDVAGDASKMQDYLQQALSAADESSQSALASESWASEALEAAENLGAMEEEGKLLLRLLEDVNISENKAAYLAFLSRAAVPSIARLTTNTVEPVAAGEKRTFNSYDKSEYNMTTAPVNMHVDSEGTIEFSDDCDLLISAKGYFSKGGASNATGWLHFNIEYYDEDRSLWTYLIRSTSDYLSATAAASQAIPSFHYQYKKGMKLRYTAVNNLSVEMNAGMLANSSFIQFIMLPDVSRFPSAQMPRVVDVTVSEQDIAPGAAIPRDSLYLVVDPL